MERFYIIADFYELNGGDHIEYMGTGFNVYANNKEEAKELANQQLEGRYNGCTWELTIKEVQQAKEKGNDTMENVQIFVNVNEPIGYIVEGTHVYLIHINEGISYRVNHTVMDAEEEALQCVDNDSEIAIKLLAIVYGETSKDIEVQETVQQAMELDVAPSPTAIDTFFNDVKAGKQPTDEQLETFYDWLITPYPQS